MHHMPKFMKIDRTVVDIRPCKAFKMAAVRHLDFARRWA